jgi:integrase/recombinase XerC
MTHYASTAVLPPKTLTLAEQAAILTATGTHKAGFRDHVLFSFALGTGLREHELAALNVGDVRGDTGIRRRFPLRVFKKSNRDPRAQEAILPDALRFKLEKFCRWKKSEGEALGDDAPLFASRQSDRLSMRQIRRLFATWQERARFERRLPFHSLRHTALTNLYRASRDMQLVQKIARHRSILSTTIYAHASDEDVLRAVRTLAC